MGRELGEDLELARRKMLDERLVPAMNAWQAPFASSVLPEDREYGSGELELGALESHAVQERCELRTQVDESPDMMAAVGTIHRLSEAGVSLFIVAISGEDQRLEGPELDQEAPSVMPGEPGFEGPQGLSGLNSFLRFALESEGLDRRELGLEEAPGQGRAEEIEPSRPFQGLREAPLAPVDLSPEGSSSGRKVVLPRSSSLSEATSKTPSASSSRCCAW